MRLSYSGFSKVFLAGLLATSALARPAEDLAASPASNAGNAHDRSARTNTTSTLAATVVGSTISVDGLLPHASALLFGVSVATRGFNDAVRRWDQVTTDDDGDGRVIFDLGSGIPVRSLWTVVDLRSSDYLVVTPEGDATPQPVPTGIFRHQGNNNEVNALELTGSVAYVVVQRGTSAWGLNADANGQNDDDSENPAVMAINLKNLRRLSGDAAAPSVLLPGDLVLVIDPLHLEFYAARITR